MSVFRRGSISSRRESCGWITRILAQNLPPHPPAPRRDPRGREAVNESDEDMRRHPSHPIGLTQCSSCLGAFRLTPFGPRDLPIGYRDGAGDGPPTPLRAAPLWGSAWRDSLTHSAKAERGMKV